MKNRKVQDSFYAYLKDESLSIAGIVMLLIISVALELVLPIQIKNLFNEISIKPNILLRYLLILLTIISITSLVKYIYNSALIKLSNNISSKIQRNIIKHIIEMDYLKFTRYDKGQVLNRFTNDIKAVEQILKNIFPSVLKSIIYIVSSAVILFLMNSILCMIALLVVGAYLIVFKYLNNRIVFLYRKDVMLNDEMVENTQDVINGVKDIKMWKILEKILSHYSDIQRRYFGNKLKLNCNITASKEVYAFIKGLGSILIISIGSYFISLNKLTFGELFAFTMYLNSLYSPAIDLLDASNDYNKCLSNIERIFELSSDMSSYNGKNLLFNDDINVIEFINVSFSFNDKPVIENVNFKLEKGHKYALIGKTGEGKSTLLNIMLGLYKPTSGSIRLNNSKEITFDEYKVNDLNISAILQDSYIFNRSLSDNILMYGDTSLDSKLKKSCITELADRLNDNVGQNGNNLSGGQRQRLLISRVFGWKSKILILDECTSALDAKTEKEILDNIFDEYSDSIIIICSHQQQVMNYVDSILYLENRNITVKDAV
jgi:ABC-type multidrug transport system fused ATPase/permease subunit